MSNKLQEKFKHFIPEINRIHRVNESCQILGMGRSTYYLLRQQGFIDPPVKISKRARGHTTEYLQALIEKMGAA
jgi:predicted DNA-binding transcriptional regulator AlpA